MADHDTLAAALVAALKDLTVIEKAHTANAGSYSYDYADLGDTVKVTRTRLAEHGIVALTPVHGYEAGGLACTVELIHTSGETKVFPPFPFPAGRDAQATGSMVTYHRRYALTAALGLATGEDDDGAKAVAVEAVPPVPGFRSSLTKAIAGLTDAERETVRKWVAEQGLPDRPALMDAEQSDLVVDFILHGLPKNEEES